MAFFKKIEQKNDTPNRRVVNTTPSLKGRSASDNTFIRNRTLSSRYTNHSQSGEMNEESARKHLHHLSGKRRKVGLLLLISLLFSIVLWMLLSNFTARTVIVNYDSTISKGIDYSKYDEIIQDYFGKNIIERFTFLLNEKALSDYVMNQAPEVENVSMVGFASIGETSFRIDFRRPVAGWKINNDQYYVDSKGIPFEKSYYDDPGVQIVDKNSQLLGSGQAVISNKMLSFVGKVVAFAKGYGNHTVTQATLPENKTRELDISLQGVKSIIKLVVDRPVGEQVEDMSRALDYFNKKGVEPTYIDVRVKNKAYYK